MIEFNLRGKVIAFFQENPEKKATTREIGEWVAEKYPDYLNYKIDNFDKTKDEALTQIVAEISSISHIPGVECERVGRRLIFYLASADSINTEGMQTVARVSTIPSKQKVSEKFAEDDMYDPLIDFLKDKHKVDSKRIEHRNARKSKRGGDMWLYPDLVGLQDLSVGWNSKVRDCVKLYSDKMSKLWSFELKKAITPSNVREYFFQAVSNSSWANFGYLVACEIDDQSLEELRILSNLHGIGFIKLIVKNYQDSQIIIPSQEKKEIDWSIVNRLSKNTDYKEYITLITGIYKSDKYERSAKWDSD